MKPRYFFYEYAMGELQEACNHSTVLISTVALPDFSPEHEGKCSSEHSLDFPEDVPIGTMFNISFGDPRIMMNCKLIAKGPEDVPQEILDFVYDDNADLYLDCVLGFEYGGGTFYVNPNWMCRLEDLE